MKSDQHNWKNIEWLVTAGSTFSMGAAAAFVFSIESINPTVQFALNWKVGASFVIVAMLTYWGCCSLLYRGIDTDTASLSLQRRWFYTLTVLGIGGSIAGMAYSLRGVSHEKLLDVGFGVLLASLFLSIACVLLWRTVQFLESEEAPPRR